MNNLKLFFLVKVYNYWPNTYDLLGRVGKTSLVLRYLENKFNPGETSTSNAAYLEKVV